MKVTVLLRGYQGYDPPREVKAYKTAPPKMTLHRGRTWDTIGHTDKGEKIFADTTWGLWGYFQREGQYYKFPLYEKRRS